MRVTGWSSLLAGTDPRLRRMLGYYAGTCLFYLAAIGLLWVEVAIGEVVREQARVVTVVGAGGMAFFYVLLRTAPWHGIAHWQLSIVQALYAIGCNVALYAITGPVRGASLMVLLVVIVFCTFSLSPRQTLGLFATTLLALGGTIVLLNRHDPSRYPAMIEAIHFALAAISLTAVTALTAVMSSLRKRLSLQKQELQQALATIRTLATVDELTALANRRHMNELLRAEEKRQHSHPGAVCLALLDIDMFKAVNDRYGHACGDAVLRQFADIARAELRASDVLARWGGEEFLLLLPDTQLREAQRVLQRVAERFRCARIPGVEDCLHITFSAGLVERRAGEPFSETICRADKAMYAAKSSGRDRIVVPEAA